VPERNLAPFQLSDQAITSLTALVRGRASIRTIVESTLGVEASYGVRALSRRVAAISGTPHDDVFDVLSALLVIHRFQTFRHLDPESVVTVFSRSLERYPGKRWDEELKRGWEEATPTIAWSLAQLENEDNPLLISEKAEALVWSHQNVLFSSRVITDVRPVFDASGTKILEVIVTNSLHVEFTTGRGGQEKLVFAMDATDVAELRRACERAEVKIQTALREFESHKPIAPPTEVDR
jgi:hypothetical protein